MKPIHRSLSSKMLLCVGGALVVILGGAVLLGSRDARIRTEEAVHQRAELTAKNAAEGTLRSLTNMASVLRTMTDSVGAKNASGMRDRTTAMSVTKAAVERNDLIFGAAIMEEPAGFDGRQDAGLLGNNDRGTFAPYWSKAKSAIALTILPDLRNEPWYRDPAQKGSAIITEPYFDEATGQKILMTTIAAPIRDADRLIGVCTIDIRLETLTQTLSAMRPFGEGRVMLVSGQGTWVATPDAERLMKPYEGAGLDELRASLADGRVRFLQDFDTPAGAMLRIIYPFTFTDLGGTWATIVDIPASSVAAPVREQAQLMIGGGILLLLTLLASLYAATLVIVRRPVAGLLAEVERLGGGDYDQPVAGQENRDEIGSLAKALEGFRHALANGRQAEGLAAEERERADAARRDGEADRAANANEQARIVDALGRSLARLAAGDLTYRLPEGTTGAFGRISDDFNSAVSQLETTMAAVTGAVGNIDGNTGEISGTAQEMARRIEGQAASLEETSAALGEITTRVNQSAEFAIAAAQTVKTASRDAQASDAVVHQAVEAMRAIETSSKEIGKIIGVIDEIAFQTNLLALNAGVEAARAGETGRGFAVVATEVRGLAQRSADAARQIKDLISAASREVEDGVDLVERAGESLRRIASQVLDIDSRVLAIAEGAREQSSGIKEINTAIGHMDQTTQQNAAMLEEAAAASQSLRTEADELKALVARFTTGPASAIATRELTARRAA